MNLIKQESGDIELRIGTDADDSDIHNFLDFFCDLFRLPHGYIVDIGQKEQEKKTVWHNLQRDGYPKPPYDPRGYLIKYCRLPVGVPYFYEVVHFFPGVEGESPHFQGQFEPTKAITSWAELPEEPEEMVK